jgi:transcriptional regulator with XRE-family HTH domain
MEERAAKAGHPISRSMLSSYMRGEAGVPTLTTIAAIAAALDVSFPEVAASVDETYRLQLGLALDPERSARRHQRTEAWVRLTGDRTEAEVEELLLIVEQVLRMRDLESRAD